MSLLALLIMCAASQAESVDKLEAAFSDPPNEHRILKIIHSWPDEADQQDKLIRTLLSQGFGGVVCNISFQDYMESEAKWQAFVRAVQAAREAGMSMWLYDEKGYPSGVAGGLTLRKHPEFEASGLLLAEATTNGEAVSLDVPPGRHFLTAAFPLEAGNIRIDGKLDLQQHVRDGKLSWSPVSGEWHVMLITESELYEGTHAQLSLADKLPYINLLQPEATTRFIEVTHEQYADRLGEKLGALFAATFTDEPSLMSAFLRSMPYRVIPWSPDIAEVFRERRGYALEPWVPALFTTVGGDEKRVRHDFWLTVSELVADGFFGQLQDWCQAHGLPSGGHLLAEESITNHVPLYGDFFRCLRRLSAPSIDCLTSLPGQVPWYVAKFARSAAELEGHTLTMCETSDHSQVYRPQGDTRPRQVVTEDEIRGTLNRLFVGGITTITSYYSFAELSDEQLRQLNAWAGRCSSLLQGGHLVTDIAMLYPSETLWQHYQPTHHWGKHSAEIGQVANVLRSASEALYAAGRDFIYIDSQALEDADVENGTLVHGNLRWRVLVLPRVDTLPAGAWEKVVRFWRSGGIVVSLGTTPANTTSEFPSESLRASVVEMFGDADAPRITARDSGATGVFLPIGTELLLPQVLDGLLEQDVQVTEARHPIRATHRRISRHEVYLLINDSPDPWQGNVSFAAQGEGQRWDPKTGSVTSVPTGKSIPLSFEPYGATLLRFPAAGLPLRLATKSHLLEGMSTEPLPHVEPGTGHGEFVRAEVTATSLPEFGEVTAWKTVGTITKGEVDTFLFLMFRYPEPLDLNNAQMLVIDTWAPPGQRTSPEILVILRDTDGADYLANTGRQLATSGYVRIFLPIEQFQLAGWSTDPSGRLEREQIAAISVGWGGHYGKESDHVAFSLALPRIASLGTEGAAR